MDAHVRAIKLSRIVFDEATEMGFQMKLLDIGGGFTCKTTNDYCKIDFTQVCNHGNRSTENGNKLDDSNLFSELGSSKQLNRLENAMGP